MRNLPEEDREPACVRSCPARARHFGDLGDPDSDVSRLVAERDGFDLMPEQETRPVNQYLPPRERDGAKRLAEAPVSLVALADPTPSGLLGWLDRTLSRLG